MPKTQNGYLGRGRLFRDLEKTRAALEEEDRLKLVQVPPDRISRYPEPDIQISTPDIRKPKEDESRYRSRRERRQKLLRLPIQKLSRWEAWCAVNRVDFQDLVERAVDGYLDSHVLIDDYDEAKTDEVLIFYQLQTGNRVTRKDREALAEVAHLAPHVVKAGVLLSLMRAKKKINSFRYCLGAIEEMAESGAGSDYLDFLLSKLEDKK